MTRLTNLLGSLLLLRLLLLLLLLLLCCHGSKLLLLNHHLLLTLLIHLHTRYIVIHTDIGHLTTTAVLSPMLVNDDYVPQNNTDFLKSWIEQCFMSPPTQYRLYGRRFLQVKRPNQQYQSTEGTNSTQTNQTYNKQT